LLVLAGLALIFSISLKLKQAIAGILAMRLLVQFIGQAVGVILPAAAQGHARAAVQNVAVSPAGSSDDDRLGVALLADRCDAKVGAGGGSRWGALAFLIRAREVRQWPFASSPPAVAGSQ